MATNGSSPSAANRTLAAYIAMVIISPCAKFTTRTTPKITDRPSAIRPYTRPVRTPAITTFRIRSGATRISSLLVFGHRKYRLGRGGVRRQHDRWHEVAVLHASRADALDLAFLVEFDRRAERHFLGDIGLADGVGQRLRIGRLRALERVGRYEDRLEGEGDVQPVEHQLVLRVLLEEGLLDHL